jgi:hypothetical protein
MRHRVQQRDPAGDAAQAPPRNLTGGLELGPVRARRAVRGKAGRATRGRSQLTVTPRLRSLASARRLGRGIALGQNLRCGVADIGS